MKQIITLIEILLLSTISTGCATLFGSDNHPLTISSEPSGADIYINGFRTGSTPMVLNLKPNKPYTIEFQKEGFAKTTRFLDTKIDTKWIIIDILGGLIPIGVEFPPGAWNKIAGLIPVAIDATSGAWNKFDQDVINVVLDEQK